MRRLLILALLAISVSAHAGSTYRVGSEVLTIGDSAVRAMQLMGKPDFKEPVQSDFGGYQGERWQYLRDDGRVVVITILNGKIADIADRSR